MPTALPGNSSLQFYLGETNIVLKEKYFQIFVNPNQNWIVITLFQLI